MKRAPIVHTVKNGALRLPIGKYADGPDKSIRFGFDYTPPGGQRKKRRHNTLEDAIADGEEKIGVTNAGKLDRMAIDEEEFCEFLRWKAQRKEGVKIPKLIEDFLESRRSKGRSGKHIRGLEGTLGQFSETFSCELAQLTREGVEKWLDSRKFGPDKKKIGPRRWNNMLADIVSMVRFARKDGKIGSDLSPVELIDRKTVTVTVLTYTPAEMERMLELCPRPWVPHLVLGAFCGLRPEETCPEHRNEKTGLKWGDVNWEKGKVIVPAEVSKDRRRRFAPLTDAARAFLLPWAGEEKEKPVAPNNRIDRALLDFKRHGEVDWRPDALRHSFASYRLAMTEDIPALALAMGNSATMIHRHYLDLKHRDEAEKFFGIRPK